MAYQNFACRIYLPSDLWVLLFSPLLYLKLPQVDSSVSRDVQSREDLPDLLLIDFVVTHRVEILNHLLDVDEATVVTVDGIEEFLMTSPDN